MTPPFRITPRVLSLATEIGRLLGRCEGASGAAPAPELLRRSRARSVQGSIAIEGNTLSLDQVSALLEGKAVIGPSREIVEARNAIRAYALAPSLNAASVKDLLRAHRVMMAGLIPDAGRWRAGDVGVVRGAQIGHVAPGAHRVPELMDDLLRFVADDQAAPPLVRACVVHYEIEFIHPFSDGNGRLGRLWQHVALLAESPIFAFLPAESVIRDRQEEYYATLAACDQAGDSTAFIELSLDAVREALAEIAKELRPRTLDAAERLDVARRHFLRRSFTRSEYLALHRQIAPATASRDLRRGVETGVLDAAGDKATARYRIRRRR